MKIPPVFFDLTLKKNRNAIANHTTWLSQDNDFVIPEELNYSQGADLLNDYLKYSIDSAILKYNENKNNGYDNYNYNEEEISFLGKTLIDYDIESSVKLFAFNTEQYPNSWHAYFDLGFSYQLKNELDLAKKAFLKAQEMNPDNNNIKIKLAELSN